MFLVSLCQPNIGFLLPRTERYRFLETLDGSGNISAKHFRGHQVLTAEPGPHTRILVVERHSLGIFFFDLRAELRPRDHRLPQTDLSAIKIREQPVPSRNLSIDL